MPLNNTDALSAIELSLMRLLDSKGPIRGTAQVGYALWPNRSMQPQGAALAAGRILRRLLDKGHITSEYESQLSRYDISGTGREALSKQKP